jgi:predicted amidohydrolase YtcJ
MSYAGVLLSQRGFAMLNITSEDDLQGNARFERDAQGHLTGWIMGDLAAVVALYERLPKPSLDEAKRGTLAFFRTLHGFGVTGVSDPGGHNLALHQYAAVQELAGEGALTMRVRYSLCAPRAGNELSDFQALTQNLPMGAGDDVLRFNGIGECVTWGLYNNDTPDDAQVAQFEDVALFAARAGLGLTVHWNNESSVHRLLDIFERVGKQVNYAQLRWSIAHIHDARPETLQRMGDLHLGWLMQNRLYFAAPAFLANYESSRLSQMPPIAGARRLGVPVGGGTDADRVMSPNPFVALRWMLDGRTLSGLATRGPQEVPTREEALRIWTQGSAWFSHEEARRGVLKVGALADLAVLSGDFFELPVEEITGLRSELTMVGGRVVHAQGAFASLSSQ